ncbi:MAG TPA: exodeoxyribonuclease VII small subunit [Coleofasciculaceae cyanobacterium]
MVNRSSKSVNSRNAEISGDGRSLTPDTGWNYEATVQKIEAIMTRIESGELELGQVFDQFTEAVTYLQQCEHFLTQHQQQMDLLIETLTDDMDF